MTAVIMKQQALKDVYKRNLKDDDGLKYKLAVANKKRIRTIDEWRRNNGPMLTTATNLAIIREHLNLSKDEILTEVIEVDTL